MKRNQFKDTKQMELEFKALKTEELQVVNANQAFEGFLEDLLCFNSDLRLESLIDNIGTIKRRCLLISDFKKETDINIKFQTFYLLVINDISRRLNKSVDSVGLEDLCYLDSSDLNLKECVDLDNTDTKKNKSLIDIFKLFTGGFLPATKSAQRQLFRDVCLKYILDGLLGSSLQLKAESLLPEMGLVYIDGALEVIEYDNLKPVVYDSLINAVARLKGLDSKDVNFSMLMELTEDDLSCLNFIVKGEFLDLYGIGLCLNLDVSEQKWFHREKKFREIIYFLAKTNELGLKAYHDVIIHQCRKEQFRNNVLSSYVYGIDLKRKFILCALDGGFGVEYSKQVIVEVMHGDNLDDLRFELMKLALDGNLNNLDSKSVFDLFFSSELKDFRKLFLAGQFCEETAYNTRLRIVNGEFGKVVAYLIRQDCFNGILGEGAKKQAEYMFGENNVRKKIVDFHRQRYLKSLDFEIPELEINQLNEVEDSSFITGNEVILNPEDDNLVDVTDDFHALEVDEFGEKQMPEIIIEDKGKSQKITLDLARGGSDIVTKEVASDVDQSLKTELDVDESVSDVSGGLNSKSSDAFTQVDLEGDVESFVGFDQTVNSQERPVVSMEIPKKFKQLVRREEKKINKIVVGKSKSKPKPITSNRYVHCVKGYAFEQLVGVYLAFTNPQHLVIPQYCLVVDELSGKYSLRADFRVGPTIYEVKWGNATENILKTIAKHKKAIHKSGYGFYYKVFMCVENPSIDSSFYTLFEDELESKLKDRDFFDNVEFILFKLKQLVDLHDVKLLKLIENALNAMIYKMLHGYIEDRSFYLKSVTSDMADVLRTDHLTSDKSFSEFIKRNLLSKRMSSFAAYFEYQNVIYSGFLSISIKYEHMEAENVLLSDQQVSKPKKTHNSLEGLVDKPVSKDDTDSEIDDEKVFEVPKVLILEDGYSDYEMLLDEYDAVIYEESNLSMSELLRKFRGVSIK